MLDHLRLETLVGLGAASLLGYVLWGPKTTKPRAANAAGALAGLQNIGNSCFLNAVLQALASSPAVIRWLGSPPSAGTSPAHRQLRAALIDVIQVVNRTHPDQHGDPFTPAGVVACLLRLGWLIRRDEQDTHEMLYVLVSTLQEAPPPPPLSLSAEGLRAGDGPVEQDTGEHLVDWGAIGARMRGEAREICGAGAEGGAGARIARGSSSGRKSPLRGVVSATSESEAERSGAVHYRLETEVRVGAESGLSKNGDMTVNDTGAGADPRENGDTAFLRASGDIRAPGRSVDEEDDRARDSGAADDGSDCAGLLSLPDPPNTEPSSAPNSRPKITNGRPATTPLNSPPAAVRTPPDGQPVTPSASGPGSGVVGRRQLRGIVHRVRGASSGDSRGAAGPLRSPFTGTVSTQLVCQACQHKCAVRWENFETLSLPLPAAPRPQPLSLPSLLGQFSARETVYDVTCDACHRRGRFSKRTLVAKLPSALCLHLPRTTWQDNGQAGKRGDHVSFLETLNMFPYTYGANVTTGSLGRPVSPPLDSGRHLYRLTAVIVHTGGPSSGHFVTYRRRADPADDRWFYTSDTLVSRASSSEVFSSAAYMLFYDRVAPAASPGVGSAGASPMAAALLSPVAPALLSPGSPLGPPPAGHGC